VTSSNLIVTSGNLTFKEGGNPLAGPLSLNSEGVATFSTSVLSTGTHTITAEYSGAGDFDASSGNVNHVVVDKADTSTTVVASVNPSLFGQNVTFTAAITAEGAAVTDGTVTFKEGETVLAGPVALDSAGQASFATAALAGGNHTIRAEYSGGSNFNASASHIEHRVKQPPTVSAGSSYSVAEGGSVTLIATGTGSDEGSLLYSWDLDENGTFETSGQTVTFSAATLEGPASRIVKVQATDADGLSATAQTTVEVGNVAPALSPLELSAVSIVENGVVTVSGGFSDPGTLDTHTIIINWGDGSAPTTLAVAAGLRQFAASHQYLDDAPSSTASDVNAITVTVVDDDGGGNTASANLIVNNLPPVIKSVTAPTSPVARGSAVALNVNFTDSGTLDNHACAISWGDSQTTSGCSDTHVYADGGVYSVHVTVTDDDTGSASTTYQYIVVYDPADGFVTGGGSIHSPAGAYTANPALTGKASFGFVSKYNGSASVPAGQTQFHLQAANFTFHLTSYEWLVISNGRAQYAGRGKVNGVEGYRFLLTAIDGNTDGGDRIDRLALQIWDPAGALVYNNAPGAATDINSVDAPAIANGQIAIHSR
jgi:hypothetical protein